MKFSNPPVDEVVVGLSLGRIHQPEGILRIFLEKHSEQFPTVLPQARMEVPRESLIPQLGAPPALTMQPIGILPQVGRTWLISQDDSTLVQLQDDLFYFNWRRRRGSYPGFDRVEEQFWTLYSSFVACALQVDQQTLEATQLDVTYINWIPDSSVRDFLSLSMDSALSLQGTTIEAQHEQWISTYLLPDQSGRPYARLTAVVSPAVRVVGETASGYQFALSIRVPIRGDSGESHIRSVIQLAHEAITAAFLQLTSVEAKGKWGASKV